MTNRALPQLAAVRVVSGDGPYAPGTVLSLAFVNPSFGRLCDHEDDRSKPEAAPGAEPVPETISVTLLRDAEPYERGARLVLSFFDPAGAIRIHPIGFDAPISFTTSRPMPSDSIVANARPDPAANASAGVFVRLQWTETRVARFTASVERLLAVDRLGWYRHALIMRMLLPDEIAVSDSLATENLNRELRALRSAATAALGTPLLAALIPNFSVDGEWLHSIESPALLLNVAAMRESIHQHLRAQTGCVEAEDISRTSCGEILRAEFDGASSSSVEAFLPLLIPGDGHGEVGSRLRDYRTTLLELFGQTAHASLAVRLAQLTLPNPVLDDRVAALAHAVRLSWPQLSVA